MRPSSQPLQKSFNPRPARVSGATFFRLIPIRSSGLFQSAPRSCERGDMRWNGLKCEGFRFQSAPRSCERGDPIEEAQAVKRARFNPRPARVSGATWRSR